MDFEISETTRDLLGALDTFIEREIVPLEEEGDNRRFFDHRREWARTDFERDGVARAEWEQLLAEAKRRADAAGFYRYSLPSELGGHGGTNLEMAVIREHLAHRGLGLHNDLQTEHSVVGNLVFVELLHRFGTAEQRERFVEPSIRGENGLAFALTEPEHGSDATWMSTRAVRAGGDWVITGVKRFNTLGPATTHDVVFARTSGEAGQAKGITAFIVPLDAPGLDVPHYWWTLNMPTDHAEVTLDEVRVPSSSILGEEGEGLAVAQTFVHENRIRQAASGVGAAQYCIDRSVAYARERTTFGRPLASRQAVQWPLVELHTEAEMVRTLIHKTAQRLDEVHAAGEPAVTIGHLVSMCNYRGNRLVCDAADRAMQVHGGIGYTRHEPFEHIYRHHRRYRITEGSEEIQMRRVAGRLFGYL
ncbi:acyl-CoA dehydrogenase family protein [Actinomadura latina]|uniref:Acyl-CoA dehydrogenase family protein n=1 Tax=Actinomadura latina TaxID=163603 RepID=A0A846ZBB9_9ACTN|nr:acyl-CoA dehydrogenase family protein [Actinomadura latina]NKZ08034.1 acyl-CoA dehydrogenase family protein [Actinomadura latina]